MEQFNLENLKQNAHLKTPGDYHLSKKIIGLSQILTEFEAVLVDQYGVLHNGQISFDAAKECLIELKKLKIPVVTITNSGRLKSANWDRMESLGFTRDLVNDIVTSGELSRKIFQNELQTGELKKGDSVTVIDRDDDISVLLGLGLEVTAKPTDKTKLIQISGVRPEKFSREYYQELLFKCAQSRIPAICANPDTVIYTENGSSFGPGLVAADYESNGGPLRNIGKPYFEIFVAALNALEHPIPSRTLMIGDSPQHDIVGGKNAGCKTLLICNGVQAGTGNSDITADYEMDLLKF